MAETLLAILLVTSSAKGSSLVYRWPASPVVFPRLSRPRFSGVAQPDNPQSSARSSESNADPSSLVTPASEDGGGEYEWKRPNVTSRDRSLSHSTSHPTSGRNTPSPDGPYHLGNPAIRDEYDTLFDYSTEFLAGMLCPQSSLCHQKFELVIDELVFLGHPVCAEADGVWKFKPESSKRSSRGRGSRNRHLAHVDETSPESHGESPSKEAPSPALSTWLQTFHFVMVLDLPDPSSSASGNVDRYLDIIYEQICFTVTAVLFQEQVLSNFVEAECEALGALKDEGVTKGTSFPEFMSQALQVSSIAPAMKSLYEAIKSSSMAYITIHDLPLELQLPPYLDYLLHSEEEYEMDLFNDPDDEVDAAAWGRAMGFGWRLPSLAPWKSLLLLDGYNGVDPYMNLKEPHVSTEDRTLAEGLLKFLETASVTLSLADMSHMLDWNLESQVFPTVRWLVHHRRAKVVDIVHPGLKTVFTLPPKFDRPLSALTAEFETDFTHPSLPPLPNILSTISTSSSKKSDNHFFATVVQSKDLIPLYHDVVLWMLKRDLLITLHLRIRVVATQELKMRVKMVRERTLSENLRHVRRRKLPRRREEQDEAAKESPTWMSMSPKSARRQTRPISSVDSEKSNITDSASDTDDEDGEANLEDDDEIGWDDPEDDLLPSMINDPGKATPLQRRWLSAMSDGKNAPIARRFEQINQYFDGNKTDNEILFLAEISRKQLREILHEYDEYLQTFLLPS